MLKLTRLDRHVIAINPDHITWVEATPDTTICLAGDRKIIVRESLDEVVERFIEVQRRFGRSLAATLNAAPSSDAVGEH